MAILEKKYIKCNDYKPLNLDLMYAGNKDVLDNLDFDLENIVNTEGPLTYNTLKERLREAFGIGKISQKALDIIIPHLKQFNFKETNNLYDNVIWPDRGIFDINYIRVGYVRQIYDIPKEEISNVAKDYINEGLKGEELYHKILYYFGYQVLTAKAQEYLHFVCKNL